MSDLGEAAAELYALPPEEFVGARTRLVKEARKAGDKALAGDIGALRKPTRTAWLVNALARENPTDIGALLDLGDELRAAQEQRDGATLRTLSARRRREIDALVKQAIALGSDAGHPPTEATVNEVAQTLQAALGDPTVAEQVRAGRLAGAAVYGGFGGPAEGNGSGGGDLAAMLAASMPAAKRGAPASAPDEDDEAARARREAEERAAALAQARDEARTALDEAQDAADRATEEADHQAAEVDRLKGELAGAEEAERDARAAARTAREEVRTRRTAADEAEEAYRAASS